MAQNNEASSRPGYTDTPFIPGSRYRVHDPERLHPRVVTPGTGSSGGQGDSPPSDAVVLFDGTSLSGWESLDGSAAGWKLSGGYMETANSAGNIRTKSGFGDCQLHLEWAAPLQVEGDSQGRGNSGVFMMGIYEIQVLDCYDNPTYADGSTAAIYGQSPPLVNACRKPGEWQTYDIIWLGPRFEGSELSRLAHATVLFNGIVVHHNREVLGKTGHKILPVYAPHPETGPLMLQDHHNPVRFRNIWYRPLADDAGA